MEIDPTNIDKQLLWRSYDQDSGHGRSYTCTFCKRGFSNAQALGGHMNIHRRDRAKLKQSSSTHEDLLLSMDTRETDDHTADGFNYSSQSEACKDQSCNPKRRASIFSRDGGHGDCRGKKGTQQLRQLSLFEERPSGCDYPMMSNFGSERGENRMQSGYGSSRAELDLELRL